MEDNLLQYYQNVPVKEAKKSAANRVGGYRVLTSAEGLAVQGKGG